jgi:predicted Fe-Mo cluster-binding NifX family protein
MSQVLRIAVPSNGAGGLDAPRSAHFGHADSFTVVDVADGAIVGGSSFINPPHSQGGCGQTIAGLAQQGVSVAIVVGMGGGPLSAMNRVGMAAYRDDQSPTPRAAVEAYLQGGLTAFDGSHVCSGHDGPAGTSLN